MSGITGAKNEFMKNLSQKNEKIGRNDFCYCESGKKYKKCCLKNDEKENGRNFSDEHYQRVREEENLTLSQLATRKALDWALEKYDNAVVNSVAHFVGNPELLEAKKAFPTEEDGFFLSQLFNEYALLDYEDEGLDATLLELYLQEKGDRLAEEEKELLRVKLNTHKTLYEAQEIISGRGLLLKDCFEGEKFWVEENKATFSVKKWDIIFARVETYPDGTKKMTGSLVGFPREADALNTLREEYEKNKKLFAQNNKERLFNFRHLMTPLIFQNIIEYFNFAKNPASKLINKDGDKLMFCEKTAEVSHYSEFVSYFDNNDLLTLTYADEKEKVYCWLDPNSSIVASFYLKNKKITIETNSEKRMRTVEDKFMADLKPWTKNWRAELKDPRDLVEKNGLSEDKELTVETKFIAGSEKPLNKKGEEELIAKQMKKHYDEWINMKLPALSGMTPLEARENPKSREQLIELLKTMENKDSHSENIVGFDIKRIKRKLGLKF